MMNKALHPRDDVDKLDVSIKEGERKLECIEDSIYSSIQWPEDYIKSTTEEWVEPPESVQTTQDQQNKKKKK